MIHQTHENGLLILMTPLGHAQLSATTTPAGLPDLPDARLLRRAVIRNLDGPILWSATGTEPTGKWMKALQEEVLVYDSDFSTLKIRSETGTVDVRIAYFGV